MNPPEKIFSFDIEKTEKEEEEESQDKKSAPPPTKKLTLVDHLGTSIEAVIVATIVIICSLVYFYWSTKGMCKFTENDGFLMTIIKHLMNWLTAGIVGVTSFFIENKKK